MEPFSIWLKFCTSTNLRKRNPLKIVLTADFQGKLSWSQKSNDGAILNLAEILNINYLSPGNPLEIPTADFQNKSSHGAENQFG